jgi:hypothetical protein
MKRGERDDDHFEIERANLVLATYRQPWCRSKTPAAPNREGGDSRAYAKLGVCSKLELARRSHELAV